MLTIDDRIRFLDEGYLRIPDVFSREQVRDLRAALRSVFQSPAGMPGDFDDRPTLGAVRFDVFSRYPELRWVLTHPPLIQAAQSLLGDDFLMLPEMSAHRGGFGDWHKDTTQQEKAGCTFQWSPTFAMVELAIYLQDNGDWGGGLDVVPGSHRKPDRWVAERGLVEKAGASLERRRLIPRRRGVTVPSRIGDLVIFDFRLDHKASWPRRRGHIREENQKYALFVACSANNSHATAYLRYIQSRPDYAYLRDLTYPDEMCKMVRDAGAQLYAP